MNHGVLLVLALCAPIVCGCAFQELNSTASDGLAEAAAADDGTFTVALETPDIELDFEEGLRTTADSCVATEEHATGIFMATCTSCHAPPRSDGGFNEILDFDVLVTRMTDPITGVKDPTTGQPARFVIPGDPMRSRLYLRMANGEMPPRFDPPLAQPPRPSVSDVSVIRYWISNCLGAEPVVPEGGAGGAPGAGGAGGAAM